MCGIAGILTFDPRDPVDEHRLQRMRDVIRPPRPRRRGAHGRRPGRAGAPASRDRRRRRAAVSRCRTRTARVWIVFNGEIYNHAQLRPGLEASRSPLSIAVRHRDDPARSTRRRATDASSACTACSRSRSGIAPRARLLLARDRLGIKPLYYACTDTRADLFASEIKAILAAGSIRPAFNEQVAVPNSSPPASSRRRRRSSAGSESCCRGIRLVWSPAEGLRARAGTGICRSTASRPAATTHVGGRRAAGSASRRRFAAI